LQLIDTRPIFVATDPCKDQGLQTLHTTRLRKTTRLSIRMRLSWAGPGWNSLKSTSKLCRRLLTGRLGCPKTTRHDSGTFCQWHGLLPGREPRYRCDHRFTSKGFTGRASNSLETYQATLTVFVSHGRDDSPSHGPAAGAQFKFARSPQSRDQLERN
jgi:hypothetical protein